MPAKRAATPKRGTVARPHPPTPALQLPRSNLHAPADVPHTYSTQFLTFPHPLPAQQDPPRTPPPGRAPAPAHPASAAKRCALAHIYHIYTPAQPRRHATRQPFHCRTPNHVVDVSQCRAFSQAPALCTSHARQLPARGTGHSSEQC